MSKPEVEADKTFIRLNIIISINGRVEIIAQLASSIVNSADDDGEQELLTIIGENKDKEKVFLDEGGNLKYKKHTCQECGHSWLSCFVFTWCPVCGYGKPKKLIKEEICLKKEQEKEE